MIPRKSSSAPIGNWLGERFCLKTIVKCALLSKGSLHRFYPFCWQIRWTPYQLLDAKLFQFEVLHLIVSQELRHHPIHGVNVVLRQKSTCPGVSMMLTRHFIPLCCGGDGDTNAFLSLLHPVHICDAPSWVSPICDFNSVVKIRATLPASTGHDTDITRVFCKWKFYAIRFILL